MSKKCCGIIYKDDKISMTQGWFYHKGEILPVEALPESDYENDSPTVYLEKVTEYSDLGDRKIVNKQGEEIASPYEKIYLKPTLSPTGDIEVKQGDLGLVERIVTACQNEITQAYKKADDNLEARVTKACETRDAALEASIKEIYGNIDNDIQNIKSDDYSVGYITKGHVTQLFGDVMQAQAKLRAADGTNLFVLPNSITNHFNGETNCIWIRCLGKYK